VTRLYRRSVLVFGLLAVLLGFAILFRTAYESGGTFGYVIGSLFIVLGTGRLYLLRKT
jgi:hypothetical protein